ncbi:uncharacterized protein [Drosophila tropicalis]|uniref:uncharacterized protein n=1 Tax=Drosophila tropicalis TaxID=46794 RepID=UPI0035ABD9FE
MIAAAVDPTLVVVGVRGRDRDIILPIHMARRMPMVWIMVILWLWCLACVRSRPVRWEIKRVIIPQQVHRGSSSYMFDPQVELAANSTLNASASAYKLRGGSSVAAMQQHYGLGSNSQQQQQYQHLLQTPQHQHHQHQHQYQHHHQHQLHQQHSPHQHHQHQHQQQQQQQIQTHMGLLPKPTYSAPSQFGSSHVLNTPSEPCDFQLNVAAASFTPSRKQGLLGLPISSQSQPLLQTPHVSSSQVLVQKSGHGNGNGSGHGNGHGHGQTSRWRRQPLPDLFNAVLGLMRELNRSVSYPEIISTLSVRLQRTEADLKRHVPHTLHSAVTNGYLRKDGNRYTLLSELEQVEIMRRNQEAAQRAKELEKEPLSWRKR